MIAFGGAPMRKLRIYGARLYDARRRLPDLQNGKSGCGARDRPGTPERDGEGTHTDRCTGIVGDLAFLAGKSWVGGGRDG